MIARILAAPTLLACLVSGPISSADEPTRAELLERIRVLEAEVEALSATLEGEAHPINLGRTSLAAVRSSGVNGDRSDMGQYYGVRNAFDDGDNRLPNGINYTCWLGTGGAGQFIEVRFDEPVTVTGVEVDGTPGRLLFGFQKGGEKSAALGGDGTVTFANPLHGVRSVRLNFGTVMPQVNELRVLGHPPARVEYEVGRPRLTIDAEAADQIAREQAMEAGFRVDMTTTNVEHDDRFVVTVRHATDAVDLCRVVIEKRTNTVDVEKLARYQPIEP